FLYVLLCHASPPTQTYTLSLHDALPISDVDSYYSHALMILLHLQQSPLDYAVFPIYDRAKLRQEMALFPEWFVQKKLGLTLSERSEEHTSELQSRENLVCRLLLEKKNSK